MMPKKRTFLVGPTQVIPSSLPSPVANQKAGLIHLIQQCNYYIYETHANTLI